MKKSYKWLCAICIVSAFCSTMLLNGVANGQKTIKSTDPEMRLKWYEDHLAMKESSIFKSMKWRFIGPTNISGRMTDVAVVSPKGKSYVIYLAGASGGVWKTENEGTTWIPVFEEAMSTSIGDVTIAPSNQEIVWIGTGEANIFRSSMAGCGVYKSIDGAKTWNHMGLTGTHTIPRIIIHPTDPDTVYVASSGHEWTDNEERGLYKTVDGGKSWKKIFYINEKTGVIDLVMDPSDPDTLYAATWQRIRKKWNDPRNEDDYTGSSIYKTSDSGKNWTEIAEGLPEAKFRGRIGIDISMSNPNVLYAFVDNYDLEDEKPDEGETDSYGRDKKRLIKGATVFRTDDKGGKWTRVSEHDRYMTRLCATYGWVFGQMRVDPNDENKIYVMGLGLNVSEDGGKSFKRLRGMHGDHHGLWIDPDNSDYLVNVNDGGAVISYDGGKNWKTLIDGLPLVQFFNVGYDMDTPFNVYGSIQDHGSRKGYVDLRRGRSRIPAVEWESAPGGEASSHAIDPTDPDIVYSAGFYGSLSMSNLGSGARERISPKAGKDEPKLRGQWVAPFIISPHNPRIIYHGMNFLFRSMNRGESWERISPDLTYNNDDMKGDIPFQTITAISESPFKFGLIYVGTDDGKVHVTKDSGANWREIMKGLPHRKWVSRIVASAYDENTVFISQNGKRDDDFAAYLWKSTDCGESWVDISGNIPCGPVNVIREDPKNMDVLYTGTDLGVYVSANNGERWDPLPGGFPDTFVHDLIIHPRDDILVAATHGRGMYAMDVRIIQKFTKEVVEETAHIFDIEPAKIPKSRYERVRGVTIAYYLSKAQNLEMLITNEKEQLVKTVSVEADAGLNFTSWNLAPDKKKEDEAKKESKKDDKEKVQSQKKAKSKYVEPGKYRVSFKVNEEEFSCEFEIK